MEIKRLERDKRLEEIRQLRAGARLQWITPTALAAFLPLLAGLGVWMFNEMKQYHEGYRTLEERDRLAAEKTELERQNRAELSAHRAHATGPPTREEDAAVCRCAAPTHAHANGSCVKSLNIAYVPALQIERAALDLIDHFWRGV